MQDTCTLASGTQRLISKEERLGEPPIIQGFWGSRLPGPMRVQRGVARLPIGERLSAAQYVWLCLIAFSSYKVVSLCLYGESEMINIAIVNHRTPPLCSRIPPRNVVTQTRPHTVAVLAGRFVTDLREIIAILIK